MASERDRDFAAELPAFIAEIRQIFTAEEIQSYLDRVEHTKFLASEEPQSWLDNPVMGAQELLRFSRVRQLLQPEY